MTPPNLAAMREVEKLTREGAVKAIITWAEDTCNDNAAMCYVYDVPPLTDAELTEIWERSQKG